MKMEKKESARTIKLNVYRFIAWFNPKELTTTVHLIFVNMWKSKQIIEHEK